MVSVRLQLLRASTVRSFLPRRRASAHKGDAGRVYIVAGSRGMAGAAVLAATGAARGGAGLVRVGIVQSQQRVVAMRAPLEATNDSLPEDKSGRLSAAAIGAVRNNLDRFQATVVAAGPGLGVTAAVKNLVRYLGLRDSRPLVLDADGLNALAELRNFRRFPVATILTPHPGELARLMNTSVGWVQRNRLEAAVRTAQRFGAVCLLKGAGTIITDGRSAWKNSTGNPGMASGGMGDVLTGLIAALWGQMPVRDLGSGFRAAAAGAFLHGRAGDLAALRHPPGSLLASDVAELLPAALREVRPFYFGGITT